MPAHLVRLHAQGGRQVLELSRGRVVAGARLHSRHLERRGVLRSAGRRRPQRRHLLADLRAKVRAALRHASHSRAS